VRLGLGERAAMLHLDWDRPGWAERLGGSFDLVIANPPYVETEADLAPSVHAHEPHGALFAGPEGLDAYRVLIPQLSAILAREGIAVIEIGATQADAVTAIAKAAGFAAKLHLDLSRRPRALELSHIVVIFTWHLPVPCLSQRCSQRMDARFPSGMVQLLHLHGACD
jgi:release factor glutamine methyltransferase